MNFNKYIGIPFVSQGRDFSGCDCYGLVKLFYKNEYNIDLPEFYEDAMNCEAVNQIVETQKTSTNWKRIQNPEPGCIVAIKFNFPGVNHVGIYLGNGKFLHTRERVGSCTTSINNIAWARLVEGFYVYTGVK